MEKDDISLPVHRPQLHSKSFSFAAFTRSDSNLSLDTSVDGEYSPQSLPSGPATPSRGRQDSGGFHSTRSVLNLTSSTLLGIYSSKGYNANREEPNSPWGTGAQSPARKVFEDSLRKAFQKQGIIDKAEFREDSALDQSNERDRYHEPAVSWTRWVYTLAIRILSLFSIGLAYGVLITQIHDKSRIVPVTMESLDRQSWRYLGFWGITSVVLGLLLPTIDGMRIHRHLQARRDSSNDSIRDRRASAPDTDSSREVSPNLGADWNPIVRSIGAFIGIAFAIRRLPWQSTLQVSLTLSLFNPIMWYLIDRTRAGFALSSAVGIIGSALVLIIDPTWVLSPTILTHPAFSSSTYPNVENSTAQGNPMSGSDRLLVGVVSYRSIGIAAWVSSALFCSCIIFGNVGRKLALIGRPLPSKGNQSGSR